MSNVRFEDWEAEQLQDPEFRRVVEELEPGYQVTRLRIHAGLTQEQLAKKVGTHQSSIARLESGRVAPRVSFLRKVVEALDGKLEIKISSQGEEVAAINSLFIGRVQPNDPYDQDRYNTKSTCVKDQNVKVNA